MFKKMKKCIATFLTAFMVFSSALIPMAPLIAYAADDSPGESVVSDSGIDGTGADADNSSGTENDAGNNNEGESTEGEEAGNSDAGSDADNGNEEAGDDADGVVGAENEQDKSVSGEEQVQAADEKSMVIVPFVLNKLELNDGYVVTFMLGSDVFSKVGVKDGEYCTEPAPPAAPAGMSFWGWYLDSAGAGERFDFANKQIDSDITLYAKFVSGDYQIKFIDANGLVFTTIQVEQGGVLTQDDVDSIDFKKSVPEGYAFKHWYVDGMADPAQNAIQLPFTVTGDLTLKPYYVKQYSLVFISEGKQVEAQIYEEGAFPVAPPDPTRDRYTFSGWVDSNQKSFTVNEPIEKDVVFYAMWMVNPGNADYTVVYWLERPNFKGTLEELKSKNLEDYVFAYSEPMSGVIGDSTQLNASSLGAIVDAISQGAINEDTGLQYAFFLDADNVNISYDGTSVVNVFCARNMYTLVFDLGNSSATMMKFNGNTYVGNGTKYSFEAKYEQDIRDLWPHEKNATFEGNGGNKPFKCWMKAGGKNFVTEQLYLTKDMLPTDPNDTTVTFTALWSEWPIEQCVYYWVERLDEQINELAQFNGKEYVKYGSFSMSGSDVFVYPQDLEKGFTYYYYAEGYGVEEWGSRWKMQGQNMCMAPYSEFLISNDGEETWQLQEYEAIWKNVGTDFAEAEYNFFYDRNQYTLNFNPVGGIIDGSKDIKSISVKYGYGLYFVPDENWYAPEKEGYTFIGWYLGANYDGDKFDFANERMPAYDITLFAKWEDASESAEFTVNFYDSVDVASASLLDSQMVKAGEFAASPTEYIIGQTVVGKGMLRNWLWKDENGKYAVYDLTMMPVTNDLDLYADWQNDGYKISYDAGGGTGNVPADPDQYAAGVSALVLSGSDLVNGDLLFAGWQIDGAGTVYYPGSIIEVTGDINLVARYLGSGGGDNPNTITVIFEANYTGGPSSIRWLCSNEDDPLTLLTADGTVAAGWTERSGYTLLHWTLGTEDEEPIFDLGGEYTFAALGLDGGSEITLYAQWQENEPGPGPGPDPDTLTVIYEANYTDGPSSISLLISKEDDPITLLTTAGTVAAGWPERSGYALLHWTLTVENVDPTFTLGGEYSFAELGLDGGSEIILYAQWQFIPSDGGGGGRGGRSTTSTSTPTPGPDEQNIEPEPTPLPPFPEPEPVNPPTEEPEVVEVPVENVPLVDMLPKTGASGMMFLWLLGLGVSLAGTVFILRRKQRV